MLEECDRIENYGLTLTILSFLPRALSSFLPAPHAGSAEVPPPSGRSFRTLLWPDTAITTKASLAFMPSD